MMQGKSGHCDTRRRFLKRSGAILAASALPDFSRLGPELHRHRNFPLNWFPRKSAASAGSTATVDPPKCIFQKASEPVAGLSTMTMTAGWTFIWSTAASAITDVTEKAGVPGVGYGMGIAVGDYDGDSFPDLLVTQYNGVVLITTMGTARLLTSLAGQAFPPPAGLPAQSGSTTTRAASWTCLSAASSISTSPKTNFAVTRESGIAISLGKSWGVVAGDVNDDGRMDPSINTQIWWRAREKKSSRRLLLERIHSSIKRSSPRANVYLGDTKGFD